MEKNCTTSLANNKQTKTGLFTLMITFFCASVYLIPVLIGLFVIAELVERIYFALGFTTVNTKPYCFRVVD